MIGRIVEIGRIGDAGIPLKARQSLSIVHCPSSIVHRPSSVHCPLSIVHSAVHSCPFSPSCPFLSLSIVHKKSFPKKKKLGNSTKIFVHYSKQVQNKEVTLMKNAIRSLTLLIAALLISLESAGQDALLRGLGLDSDVAKEETSYTCIPLPPATPPAQHSSAEGLPPLPLPVVPLRRTEKKNPPRPPVLIAKIATKKQSDWATNQATVKIY